MIQCTTIFFRFPVYVQVGFSKKLYHVPWIKNTDAGLKTRTSSFISDQPRPPELDGVLVTKSVKDFVE